MAITADLVRQLRERTGSGMMDCKKALVEADGNIDVAAEILRKKGSAQADKKATNVAAEGRVAIKTSSDNKTGLILEINCQTDFVARDESFKQFVDLVAKRALEENTADVEVISDLPIDQNTSEKIEQRRQSLVAKLGENIQIRRAAIMHSEGVIGTYSHGDRIGVLAGLSTDDKELGKDLAMHIVASRPRAILPDDIPQEVIKKEREIFYAQAQGSGKPADVIEKMVEGRIKKFLNEECLIGQPFVKDPSTTIGKLLSNANAKVTSFIRFEVGEGIEKKTENFADEVMAQVRGSK
jgi:elongation factor Ts